MRKRPTLLSYRLRISLAMALFAVIPFLIMIVGYIIVEAPQLTRNVLSQHVQTLEVYDERLDRGIQEIEAKAIFVKNNPTIRSYLNRMQTLDLSDGLQFINELQEMDNVISVDYKELSLRWYTDYSGNSYGGYCFTKEDLADYYVDNEEGLNKILEMGINETLMLIRKPGNGTGEHAVFVYTKVENIHGADHILEISLPIAAMVYPTQSELPGTYCIGACFAQSDNQQTVVLQGAQGDAQACLDTYYQTGKCKGYYPLEITLSTSVDGRITCLLQNSYVYKLLLKALLPLGGLVLVLIVMVLICSYITSVLLTRKVMRFITHIDDEMGHCAQEKSSPDYTDQDLADIAQRVRELAECSREQGKRLEAYKVEKKQMELELLQMRFNPHFLYNTLGSIRYQVKDKRIVQSIDSLIAYYRIVLSKSSLLISIEAEIKMVQEFLKLETFAYNLQNISYIYEIEEEVKQYTIIKHLLQPIVENALEHGVRGTGEGGSITIRARTQDQKVVFEVEDTGIGMTPEQIEQLSTNPCSSTQLGGYGVYNVIQRIKAYYGPEYGVEFFSEPGKGTLARITIPQEFGVG